MEIETFYTGMDVNELAKKMQFTAKNNNAFFAAHLVNDEEQALEEVARGFEITKKYPNYFNLDEQEYNDIESLKSEISKNSAILLFRNELPNEKLHYAYSEINNSTIYISSINILGYLKNNNGLFFVKNPECELELESETIEESPLKLNLSK